jgi:oxygen-independent coproporphyrinogen-3 oxidase
LTETLGLYVHVPFCSTKCRYCDFYRVGANEEKQKAFLGSLVGEIDGAPADDRSVETVFFGGGTPSLLSGAQIGEVLRAFRRRYAWGDAVEVSIEANPSDVDGARLEAWRAAGVNRLSLGVQAFNARELSLLGRRHGVQGARDAVLAARAAGFASISLDLMLAIPGQTEASFRRSVEEAIAVGTDHLSLYLLEVHRETEFDALKRKRPGLFPGEEAQRRRYLAAARRLVGAGFEHYEISNFARPGHRSRHNLKYWRCEPVIGFGPAAHSFDGRRRWRNLPDLAGYVRDGVRREEVVTVVDEERVFLGLRLQDGVRLSAAARVAGAPLEAMRRRVSRLGSLVDLLDDAADGLAEDPIVRLTAEGFVVSNAVIGRLLEGEART